jgi:hypothetical protein
MANTVSLRTGARILGQQKGSKRSKSSLCNLAQIGRQKPESRINRAIARQSSPIVASLEQACHAGGRGFESRRSRLTDCPAHSGNGTRGSRAGGRARAPLVPQTSILPRDSVHELHHGVPNAAAAVDRDEQ